MRACRFTRGSIQDSLRVGLRLLEQLDEAVQQRQADGPQQHLEAGLHQLRQALHQAALTAIHLVVRRHHVRDEGVVGRARLRAKHTHEMPTRAQGYVILR